MSGQDAGVRVIEVGAGNRFLVHPHIRFATGSGTNPDLLWNASVGVSYKVQLCSDLAARDGV